APGPPREPRTRDRFGPADRASDRERPACAPNRCTPPQPTASLPAKSASSGQSCALPAAPATRGDCRTAKFAGPRSPQPDDCRTATSASSQLASPVVRGGLSHSSIVHVPCTYDRVRLAAAAGDGLQRARAERAAGGAGADQPGGQLSGGRAGGNTDVRGTQRVGPWFWCRADLGGRNSRRPGNVRAAELEQ